jgi:hypothetical protein
MTSVERLPWRDRCDFVRTLGVLGDLEIHSQTDRLLPDVRCTLASPMTKNAAVTIRVHSRAGIPLAYASVDIHAGDTVLHAPILLLAMEGYAHLGDRARAEVERRVWSRRAYATGSLTFN